MFVRSFDTKAAPRVFREPFDIESPNFTKFNAGTVYSHTGHDIIIYFRSEVVAKTICLKYLFRWLWAKFLENGSNEELLEDNLRHKPAGCDITSSFRSVAKCN